MCARLGSRLLQVGINFFKSAGGALWGGGRVGGRVGQQKQTNKQKKHASDATGGPGVISGKHEDKTDDGPG